MTDNEIEVTIIKLVKSYAEEPWDPIWEYEFHWTGDYIETYIVIEEKEVEG